MFAEFLYVDYLNKLFVRIIYIRCSLHNFKEGYERKPLDQRDLIIFYLHYINNGYMLSVKDNEPQRYTTVNLLLVFDAF